MVRSLSIAALLCSTVVLLAVAGRADDACQNHPAATCSAGRADHATAATDCDEHENCAAAAIAQLAVLHGAELPPLSEIDLRIAMPIELEASAPQ